MQNVLLSSEDGACNLRFGVVIILTKLWPLSILAFSTFLEEGLDRVKSG